MEQLRQALKKIEQMSDCGSYESAIVNMKAIATEALKYTPIMEQLRWYSVEEKLPKVMQRVCCKTNYKRLVIAELQSPKRWDKYPLVCEDEKVTHWLSESTPIEGITDPLEFKEKVIYFVMGKMKYYDETDLTSYGEGGKAAIKEVVEFIKLYK